MACATFSLLLKALTRMYWSPHLPTCGITAPVFSPYGPVQASDNGHEGISLYTGAGLLGLAAVLGVEANHNGTPIFSEGDIPVPVMLGNGVGVYVEATTSVWPLAAAEPQIPLPIGIFLCSVRCSPRQGPSNKSLPFIR
jgi:hypothetical protein